MTVQAPPYNGFPIGVKCSLSRRQGLLRRETEHLLHRLIAAAPRHGRRKGWRAFIVARDRLRDASVSAVEFRIAVDGYVQGVRL